MTVARDTFLGVLFPVLQSVIAAFAVWFAARAFHTLLVRRDDIAVAILEMAFTDVASPGQGTSGGGGYGALRDAPHSATATDIRSSFSSVKRPSTLDAAAFAPSTAPTHATRVGVASPPQRGDAAAAAASVGSGSAGGGPVSVTTTAATMRGSASTEPFARSATAEKDPKHDRDGVTRASHDTLGALGRQPTASGAAGPARPSGPSVRFTNASGLTRADDRSLMRDQRQSAAAVIAGRPSQGLHGALGGARTRVGTDAPSVTGPLLPRTVYADPGAAGESAEFDFATAHWRRCTLQDHHIRFYIACIATALATATTMLGMALTYHKVDAMSAALNATTAITIGCLYSAVLLLITLLNHWGIDMLPRCWRAVPTGLLGFIWVSFIASNAAGLAVPNSDVAVNAPLYVSGAWAGVLALGCLATSAFTVPCRCREMQAALMVLAVALVGKVVLVVPAMQEGFVASMGNSGYITLWGAAAIMPLAAVFVTVHWHRPRSQQRPASQRSI